MTAQIIQDLGDGLILRRATAADAEALSDFNGYIHRDPSSEEPHPAIRQWTHDLASKPHPTFDTADFTIVEETTTGKIVSSLNLIEQTWSYAGIEFGVGRPELVGTTPEYRRRGLVRAQMELVHQWSAARGQLVQAITGIPHYYRLFGYEMCVALGGGRIGYLTHLPELKDNEEEAYTFRPATEADIPFLRQVHAYHNRNSLLSCVRDEASWRYELSGRSKENIHHSEVMIIADKAGQALGFLRHPATVWHNLMIVNGYELNAGVSYLAVTPAVFRYAIATGRDYAAEVNAKAKEGADSIEMQGCNFSLGEDHPVYHAYGEHMPRIYNAYNWYLRVPDLPAFLSHVGPVLEQRLADSWAAGHSGELKIGFYGPGVKLNFEKGRLTGVEAYQQDGNEDGDALFTGRTFLRLLFGYNSMAELDNMFADVFTASDAGRALLPALFPKQNSNIWPIS